MKLIKFISLTSVCVILTAATSINSMELDYKTRLRKKLDTLSGQLSTNNAATVKYEALEVAREAQNFEPLLAKRARLLAEKADKLNLMLPAGSAISKKLEFGDTDEDETLEMDID